jgi:hypothetical protein
VNGGSHRGKRRFQPRKRRLRIEPCDQFGRTLQIRAQHGQVLSLAEWPVLGNRRALVITAAMATSAVQIQQ